MRQDAVAVVAPPSAVLRHMERVLLTEADWGPGIMAVRADGTRTVSTDAACARRSLSGALYYSMSRFKSWEDKLGTRCERFLSDAAGVRLDHFDEAPETTFADIRRVIAAAAAAAADAEASRATAA